MKILLIDDDPLGQRFVKELVTRFRDISYELVVADSVAQAMPYFTDDKLAVIILDLNLPDTSGLGTFRIVHQLASHVPIIILTGTDDDWLALRGVEGGAQDYLVKGEIGVQLLQKTVQYAIERHRTLRELEMANAWLRTEEEALEERQRQLRISESLYRTLFLTVGVPTAILDEEGKVILANADVESLFGFPPGEVEGKAHWSQFIPPDELPRLTAYWRLLHEDPSQSSQRYESRLVDRWGRIRYGIISVKLIPHTKNCVVSITDITDRKRWEEALQESEVRFRELYDRMSSGVAVYHAIEEGEDFIIEDLNRAAERIEGMTRKEVFGKRVTEVFPGVEALGLLGVFRRVWKTGTPEYLPSALYRDERGTGSWRENWVYRLPSGEIVAVYNDITGRVEADAARRESEERQRLLLDYSGLGIAYWDYDGVLLFLNRKAAENLGGEAGDFTGKRMEDLFPPDLAPVYLGRIAAMRGEVGRREYEDLVSLPHGEQWYLSTFTNVVNARGEPLGVQIISQEITDRKRMEEALLQRETTLKALLNAPRDLMGLLDTRGNILAMNESGARIMKRDLADILGRNLRDLFPPGIAESRLAHLGRAVETGTPVEFEDDRDGRFFLNKLFPVFHPQHSRVEQVAVVASDITERRRAEEALRESEEKFRTVVEHVPDLILVHSDGIIRYINPGTVVSRVTGYTPGEMIGKPILDYVAPEHHAQVIDATVRRMKGDPVDPYEIVILSRNGRRTFMVSGSRIEFEGKSSILNVLTDITDRKRAESALRESEERYRAVVESQTEFITRFTPDFLVTFVNDAFCSCFGIRREEVAGKRFRPLIPEEDREAVRRHFASLSGERPVATIEHRIILPGGEVRWQKWVDRAIFDEKGALVEYQSVGRDTTDRRQAEEAVRESEARLNAVVEGSPIPQFVIGKDHRILYWNRALEEMSGIRAANIVGTSRQWTAFYEEERPVLADIVVDADILQIPALYTTKVRPSRFIEGAYEAVDFFPNLREGGGWLYFTAAPVRDMGGSIIGAVETLEDITDRKRAEEALRESEEKYRDLAEASRDLIYIIDDRDTIVYVNSRALEFLGRGMDDVVGKPRGLFFPPEANEAMKRNLGKIFSTGETLRVENPVPSPLGLSWQDTTLTPLRNPDGTVTRVMGISRDISERRQMEEALKESEEKYRNLVERANDGIVLIQDGIIAFCNRRIGDFWGGDITEITGKPMVEFVAPAEREKTGEFYVHAMSGKSLPDRFETALLRRDGSTYPAELTPGIITYRGKPAALVVIRDITERKKAEEALRESEERYRTVIETANEAIVVAQDGILKFVNPRAVEMLESTPEYIMSVPFAGFIHPDDRDMVVERYTRRIGGEDIPSNYDFRFLGKKGRVTWVQISAVRITWNGRPATLNFLMDVTERRKVEQALKDSEEMFRNPVEQSPVGVYLFQDGAIRYTNPRLSEIFGYTHEEASALPFDRIVHPDDLQKVREEIARWMQGDEGPKNITFRGVKKDGTPVDLEIYSSNMLYQGRPATYGTVIDITVRKRLEKQIRDSLVEKEVLLKEIHHRVKNNMQVISSLLSVQSQNITDETVRGLFRESQNRIRSIALVHELLYRSDKLDQIEYGVYLRKMFVPLFESYSVDRRKVSMDIGAANTMITIEKAVPCSLIVNELISNSLKHAFPGDRKGEIRIGFSLDAGSGMYALDYQDNGIGLPEGLDIAACTTLGLRLVHGLTRQLQGTLEAGNRGGAHFHITFPRESRQGGGT